MLNLAFIFDDAVRALAEHADCLTVAPLPAAVYLMQMDVINHYQYALDHYLTTSLDAPFLQNSSLGTPYQKWAYFTNEDFGLLSVAIHTLLRYTSRLVHESEIVAMREAGRYGEMKSTSNVYTNLICEIGYRGKAIGVSAQPDHLLSITAVRTGHRPERVISRATAAGPTLDYRITQGPGGSAQEQPIEIDEYERAVERIQTECINIRDRARLVAQREQGHAEVADLRDRNRAFGLTCDSFYQSRRVAEPFKSLNESYWT